MIYADHAATTRLSEKAFQAMLPWLQEEYGNPSQPYSFSRKPKKAIAEARAVIAASINAHPEEVFFTSGGTESDNWAIKGAAVHGHEDVLLTSAFEHHAVLNACKEIEKLLWTVRYVHPSSEGIISPEDLKYHLTEKLHMASFMMANNELGTIQPIRELTTIVHQQGALFHTDAVQAVGHIPVDVEDLGIDLLSASAHKFNGPKGIGFLYIRKGTKIIPHENGGGQEFGQRAGTENVAGIVGMAVALQENVEALDRNQKHLKKLEERLLQGIQDLPYIHNCACQPHLPGLLSLSFPSYDGEAILHRMDLMGICISTGSACDSKRTVISHVLQAIKMDEKIARGTIRISLGAENTLEEADAIAAGLRRIITGKMQQ